MDYVRGFSLAAMVSACHVTTQAELTRPGTIERIQHPEGAVARRPTLVLTETGTLRFIEPLECPTEEIVTTTTTVEVTTEPNLATFVVGVIATAVGGVLTVKGVTSDDRGNPSTYVGITGLVVGLPLAIGPWIGRDVTLRPGVESAPARRPGPSEPCGSRALAARSATLTVRDIEVHGAIDRDGTFAVSPYELVDAFDTGAIPALDISAIVDADGGARTIATVIEGGALAGKAPAFLASAGFDATIQPMRLVPGIVAGTLRASLTSIPTGPALRIVLPLENDGPGEAWALRGQLTSTTKAIDGRMIYLGHVAKGEAISRELIVPLTKEAAATIRGATIELSVELRDAHGTAPATPIRFRGAVLGDAPR